MDHVGGGTPPPHRHVQRLEHELGSEMVGHRPAHDPPAERVEHHRQEQKTRPGRDVGDIGDPQTVGGIGHELALHQIGRRPRVFYGDAWSNSPCDGSRLESRPGAVQLPLRRLTP
jgi:hypothetical protein